MRPGCGGPTTCCLLCVTTTTCHLAFLWCLAVVDFYYYRAQVLSLTRSHILSSLLNLSIFPLSPLHIYSTSSPPICRRRTNHRDWQDSDNSDASNGDSSGSDDDEELDFTVPSEDDIDPEGATVDDATSIMAKNFRKGMKSLDGRLQRCSKHDKEQAEPYEAPEPPPAEHSSVSLSS